MVLALPAVVAKPTVVEPSAETAAAAEMPPKLPKSVMTPAPVVALDRAQRNASSLPAALLD
jgi:hypothetical protein